MPIHATRVPTVLIGIGGIGGQIVRLVSNSLREYDREFVEMVVLDTNTNDLQDTIDVNIPYVQTSENQTVSDYLRQNPDFQKWFPMNPLVNGKNLTQGAGQIRAVSRLGALASEEAHRFDTIRDAINRVNRNVGGAVQNMIRVMIVGSVCGGTGSGMGIQLPFLVRDLVERLAHMPQILIRGLFVMPDVLEEEQDTDEKKKAVYVNAYAFLRELNAFNLAQTFQPGTDKLDIEHYNRGANNLATDPVQMANQIPYNFLFLIEKSDVNGQNIGNIQAYISKAAEIVKAQLFANDMTADIHSSEDNLIISSVAQNGMNRYCGAGFAKAVYPEEENLRYCILKFSESLLQSYWLRVDRIVKNNMSQHQRQMATDPKLMPKDMHEEFNRVFDELTDPTKFEVTADMGLLKRDLVHTSEITDSKGNRTLVTVNDAEKLFEEIDDYVEDLFDCDELAEEANDCKMSAKTLESNSAVTYCNNQLQKIRGYERDAEERVGTLSAGAADAILGSDYEISQIYSDADSYPYNVAAVLKNKHPIIARYILYHVRRELQDSIENGDARIHDLEEIKDIFEKDYYKEKTRNGEKDTNKEDPSEALMRTKPGLLSFLGIRSPEYTRLVDEIVRDASSFLKRVDELSKLKLKKTVYTTVRDRLDILIDIYEDFFDELEQILDGYKSERENLEEYCPRIRNSDIYVCSDKYCKEWLYNEFDHKRAGTGDTLTDELKQSFFDALFKEYTRKHAEKVDRNAFTGRAMSMKELFNSAVLNPLVDKYRDEEMAHLKMDIISALKLEYQIHSQRDVLTVNGSKVNPVDYDFEHYYEAIARQLRGLATPYLSYHGPTRLVCYWGLSSTTVERLQNANNVEKIDWNALRNMFGSSNGATYYTIVDDSFDKNELICYSSVYDLVIEKLDKYGKNSRAYLEYAERIDSVIRGDFRVGTGEYAYLETVHPHLDRHWHAHAYLPLLFADDELEEQKRIAKAFLLGIACRRIWYMNLDHINCWTFRPSGGRLVAPLNIDGSPASRASFSTLFNALDENPVAVNDIISVADTETDRAYENVGIGGVLSADILKQPIIAGLIGEHYSEEELSDLEKLYRELYDAQETDDEQKNVKRPINILRVIYSVYQDSRNLDLVKKLINNLTEYLNAYCLKMVNGQRGAAGKLTEDIQKAIGSNFDWQSVKDMQFSMLCEDFK